MKRAKLVVMQQENSILGQGVDIDARTAVAAAAFDAAQHPILVLDFNRRLITSNRACDAFFGVDVLREGTSAEQIGKALVNQTSVAPGADGSDGFGARFERDVKTCAPMAEYPRSDGGILSMTSVSLADGGYVVTLSVRPGDPAIEMLLSDGLNTVDIGVVLWDAAGRVRFANAAWAALVCDTQPGDTIARHAVEIRRRKMLPTTAALSWSMLYETPRQVDFTTPAGRNLRFNSYPTMAGGVMVTVLDVTGDAHAEVRARAMLRAAAEPLREGIMLLDRDKRLVMYNDAALAVLFAGIDAPKPGAHISEINRELIEGGVLPPPEGFSVEELNALYVEMLEAFTQEHEVTLGDGRVVICSTYPTELGGYLVTFREVTEARRSAEVARDSTELLNAVIAASQAMLCVARIEDGRILYASPSFYETFGQVRRMPEIYADLANDDEGLELMRTGEKAGVSRGRRKRDKHGRVLETYSLSKQITHRGEQVMVVTSLDVTEFEAMREELRRQREIAHQSEKISALGELLAGVAHELSNPLSVIVGYAGMLRDDAKDDSVRRRADRVTKAAERCARILRTFLAMARRRPASLQPCPVNDLIHNALMAAGGPLRAQGVDVIVDVSNALPNVAADRDQILQVLANLIQNASYALAECGTEGRLEIAAQANRATVDITVSDNGPGVPEALRHRLFEPFFTTKPVGEGTGIGLAFCHRVAAAHGGALSLDEGGPGATFRLRLPQTEKLAPAPDAKARPAPRNLRVLLLDDEPEVLVMARTVFERAGHRATTAARAELALRICSQTRFDAILCDARMPGIDGPGFLRLLREVVPEQVARLAFVTGDAMNPGMLAQLAATDRPLIEKPIAPEDMLALAARLAGGAP